MQKTNKNYIPDAKNTTPDYYCTWQTQLYATCDGKPEAQRANITEQALFSGTKPFGWTNFYPDIRKDLYLVMDDSWDVPLSDYKDYHGSFVLNRDKFPTYADEKNNAKALKELNRAAQKKGWKGIGVWVCAQSSPLFDKGKTAEEYWTERLKQSSEAGILYWKVDWGKNCRVPEFRKWLTALAHKVAPDVTIESALVPEVIPFCDVFRTYDVPAILSVPLTMNKLKQTLAYTAQSGFKSLINCEDEAYIAAALGCSMGIMRHPFAGAFPNGKPDMAFPSCHRNLKTKMQEVTRAVNWHKIAPAFGTDKENTFFSETTLHDFWHIENMNAELESWWPKALGMEDENPSKIQADGVAAISRNMPLPNVTPDENGFVPYLVCAKNPNGAVSIAALGRTQGRRYFIPHCDVEIACGNATTLGIFGEYKTLTLVFDGEIGTKKIYAQDLSSTDFSFDITEDVTVSENRLTILGKTIETVGNSARRAGDTSEAGLLLVIGEE